jgi:RimJ/RimL family protein N-acetyltransferase
MPGWCARRSEHATRATAVATSPDPVLWDAVCAEVGDAYIRRVSLLPEVINAADIRLEMRRDAAAKDLVEAITRSLPELARWFPWAQTPPDLEEQQARLRAAELAFRAGRDFEFSLVEASTCELVGAARLNPNVGQRRASIGYWVRTDRHHRGYASLAAGALTDAAFRHLETVTQIAIHMDQANVASAGVPRKLGYVRVDEEERQTLALGHTGQGWVWVMTRARWRELAEGESD